MGTRINLAKRLYACQHACYRRRLHRTPGTNPVTTGEASTAQRTTQRTRAQTDPASIRQSSAAAAAAWHTRQTRRGKAGAGEDRGEVFKSSPGTPQHFGGSRDGLVAARPAVSLRLREGETVWEFVEQVCGWRRLFSVKSPPESHAQIICGEWRHTDRTDRTSVLRWFCRFCQMCRRSRGRLSCPVTWLSCRA